MMPLFGTAVSLNENTLVVESQAGTTTNVDISSATIKKVVDVSLSDLSAGQAVMVAG